MNPAPPQLHRSLLMVAIIGLFAGTALGSEGWNEIPKPLWGLVSNQEWSVADDPQYSELDAVVLFDEGKALVERRGLETERHIRILTLTDRGAQEASRIKVEFQRRDKIHHIEAQVIRRDGSVVELNKKSIQKIEEGYTYSREWKFTNVEPGDIIEYSYKIQHERGIDAQSAEYYFMMSQMTGSNPEASSEVDIKFDDNIAASNIVLPSWYFDHAYPSLRSHLVVKLGGEVDYTFYTTGVPSASVQPQYRRGSGIIDRVYKYYQWDLHDVPAVDLDGKEVIDLNIRCAVHFQVFSSQGFGENRIVKGTYTNKHWEHTGRSFQGFIKKYSARSRSMRKIVKKVRAETPDPQSQAKALYARVVDNIESDADERYLRPLHKKMTTAFKKKTAAPCEANMLLTELLVMAKITAWPVLISTRDHVDFRNSGQFNHIIILMEIAANEEYVFLDASCKDCSFGSIPTLCLVKEGLLVDHDNSRVIGVVTTP